MHKIILEDTLDISKIYFHGSMSKQKSSLQMPSTRYPFYITSDFHYAMAFATKNFSSTGGNRNLSFSKNGFVYVISINEKSNIYDFRKDTENNLKILQKFIPKRILDLVYDFCGQQYTKDIYVFANALMEYMWPIKIQMSENECTSKFNQSRKILEDFYFKYNLDDYIDEEGEIHTLLHFIFDQLSNLGYNGIITEEEDINNSSSTKVTTDYAVGLWDITGFSISGIPLRYEFCKKINLSFIFNRTDQSALQKAQHYINLYRQLKNKKA